MVTMTHLVARDVTMRRTSPMVMREPIQRSSTRSTPSVSTKMFGRKRFPSERFQGIAPQLPNGAYVGHAHTLRIAPSGSVSRPTSAQRVFGERQAALQDADAPLRLAPG